MANSAAAIASANRGIATYSEFTRSLSAILEPAFRDPVPITSREASVARGAFDMRLPALPQSLSRRAHDPLKQIVHLVEERVEIVVGLVDHDLARLVVLERTDIDRLLRLQPLDRGKRRGLRRIGRAGAERRILNEVDLVAPGGEVGQRLALGEIRGVALVDRRPLVLGAGNETLGRERHLARVMAAGLDPALLPRLDDHFRSVNMAGDDVAASVDQRVSGFRLAAGEGPDAPEDNLQGPVRIWRGR